jgi:AraC-like DNA-binding protein
VGGLAIKIVRYPAGSTQPSHDHAFAWLSIVLSGSYDEATRGSTRSCDRYTIVVHPRGDTHRVRFHEATDILSVEVVGERDIDVPSRRYARRDIMAPTSNLVDGLRWFDRDAVADATQLWMYAAGLENAGAGLASSSALADIRRSLDERYLEDGMTVSSIAREKGFHPAYVAGAFKDRFGVTVGSYIRRHRVDHARALLHGPMPLSAVATSSGFADQSHLARWFGRSLGVTPGQYRKLVRGE